VWLGRNPRSFAFSAVVWIAFAVVAAFWSLWFAAVVVILAAAEGLLWYLGWRRDQHRARG
jgi:Flp pilus assembly protein TadB